MDRLRQLLQNQYYEGHATHVSAAIYDNIAAHWPYFDANYASFDTLPKDSLILEIGSGSGTLIAWLKNKGFHNTTGVEVCLDEVDSARERGIALLQADAFQYLAQAEASSFDVVILKAVLEHFTKQDGFSLLQEIARVLRPSGVAIVDVPNMDWLLAGHERYLDLTHENGFTRESLGQLLRLLFKEITISGSVEPVTSAQSKVRLRILKPLVVKALRGVFRIMGEGASDLLFESRSIIAIARNPKNESP